MNEQEEFEFRARAEREAELKRRTPKEMASEAPKEFTGSFIPLKRTEQGQIRPAVPGVIQSLIQAIKAPGEALTSQGGGDYMESKAGPGPAEAVNVAMNLLPFSRSPGLGLRAPAPKQTPLSEVDRILKQGAEEKLVTPPTKTLTGKAATFVAGKEPVKAAANIRNQSNYNRITGREAQIPEGQPLTDANYAAAREQIAQPYRDVIGMSEGRDVWMRAEQKDFRAKSAQHWNDYRKSGNMSDKKQAIAADDRVKALESEINKAGKLWDDIRQKRSDAKDKWRQYNRDADPSTKSEAQRLTEQAKSMENQLDKIAESHADTTMVDKLRQARQDLAKNYDAERATDLAGNVDIKVFNRMADSGKKLTGGLKLLAEFEDARKPAFGDELKLENAMHVGAGFGHRIGIGGWVDRIPFVSGTARRIALSRFAQGRGPRLSLGDIGKRWGPYAYPRPFEEEQE